MLHADREDAKGVRSKDQSENEFQIKTINGDTGDFVNENELTHSILFIKITLFVSLSYAAGNVGIFLKGELSY